MALASLSQFMILCAVQYLQTESHQGTNSQWALYQTLTDFPLENCFLICTLAFLLFSLIFLVFFHCKPPFPILLFITSYTLDTSISRQWWAPSHTYICEPALSVSSFSAAFDTVQFKQHVIKIARNVLAFLIRQRSLGELQRCYNSHRDFEQQFRAPTKVSETKEAAPHPPHYCNVHPVLNLKWIEVGCLTICKTC